VCHCVYCAKGKKGQREFTYRLFSLITGIKTNMLLIVFLGLIAKLALVCDGCDIGTQRTEDFNFVKVGVIVLTLLLKQVSLKMSIGFLIHLCLH
jgi:hypothetical protein